MMMMRTTISFCKTIRMGVKQSLMFLKSKVKLYFDDVNKN